MNEYLSWKKYNKRDPNGQKPKSEPNGKSRIAMPCTGKGVIMLHGKLLLLKSSACFRLAWYKSSSALLFCLPSANFILHKISKFPSPKTLMCQTTLKGCICASLVVSVEKVHAWEISVMNSCSDEQKLVVRLWLPNLPTPAFYDLGRPNQANQFQSLGNKSNGERTKREEN